MAILRCRGDSISRSTVSRVTRCTLRRRARSNLSASSTKARPGGRRKLTSRSTSLLAVAWPAAEEPNSASSSTPYSSRRGVLPCGGRQARSQPARSRVASRASGARRATSWCSGRPGQPWIRIRGIRQIHCDLSLVGSQVASGSLSPGQALSKQAQQGLPVQ